MVRTLSFIFIGLAVIVTAGFLGFVAFQIGRSYFALADQDSGVGTPISTAVTEISPTNIVLTSTVPAEVTSISPTTVPFTATAPATITVLPVGATTPAATISVSSTSVEYVMAQTDVNIRSGPGTGYGVVGWVAEGQIAKVTGVSVDSGWWRVVCPDGSTGSCWVTARIQYTQPTNQPGLPTPTAAPAACIDSAELISDITMPDGTQIAPNTGFNKIWRIKNNGTCTWDGGYKLVHAGGHLLGVVSSFFPLRDTVFPGQNVDLIINMVSPSTPDVYQSDWKLQNNKGQFFGVGRNSAPIWVKIVVTGGPTTTISGLVYQDTNQNGVYDNGETLLAGQVVQLIPGSSCHVRQDAIAAAISDGYGRYTLAGRYSGSYCVGLSGEDGLDDVYNVAVAAGQTLNDINLRSPVPSGSISGYVWNDYCLTGENGDPLDGNCVADGNGSYHADSMIQPGESYISGVTVLVQSGSCATDNNVAVRSITDVNGRYFFGNLGPGSYCVSVNAAAPENAALLLTGDWTFPNIGIWYQDVLLLTNENMFPVNFGWDYQ